MAPAQKEKRQPQPWNISRKSKLKVVCTADGDVAVAQASDGLVSEEPDIHDVPQVKKKAPLPKKGKRKEPPGPDVVTSLEDEFFKMCKSKLGTRRNVSAPKDSAAEVATTGNANVVGESK
jgi:hypothetical protein